MWLWKPEIGALNCFIWRKDNEARAIEPVWKVGWEYPLALWANKKYRAIMFDSGQ